jgi:hypothetical protein
MMEGWITVRLDITTVVSEVDIQIEAAKINSNVQV